MAVNIDDLPAPTKSNIDDLPAPPKTGFNLGAEPAKETRREYSPGQIGASTVLGGATGYFLPEISKALSFPAQFIPRVGPPVSKALRTAGEAAKGERLKEAAGGALSGAVSETAGQTAELLDATPMTAEGVRLVSGLAPSQLAGFVGAKLTGGLSQKGISLLDAALADMPKDKKAEIAGELGKLIPNAPQDIIESAFYAPIKRTAESVLSQGKQAYESALERGRTILGEGPRMTRGAESNLAEAQALSKQIGQDVTHDVTGLTLIGKVTPLYEKLLADRESAYIKQKAERDAIVRAKEQSGELLKNMPEYKTLLDELRSKLLIGKKAQEQTTAPVTEKGVLAAYQNIYDAVSGRRVMQGVDEFGNPNYKTFPTSFDALDDVRRKLGDVAFGKEAEGYTGIGTSIAKDFYRKISELQSKFAGEAHDALQSGYEQASRLVDKYKGKAGSKFTATDRVDVSRLRSDPEGIAKEFFSTPEKVRDLIELTGKDTKFVSNQASNFLARELRGKDAAGAKKLLDQDWLNELPEVKAKLANYVDKLQAAEKNVGVVKEETGRLASRAAEETAAGKAALTEAEKRSKAILGDSNPVSRVKEIILSNKQSLWNEITPALMNTPKGKEVVADAVASVMVDKAKSSSLANLPELFRTQVKPYVQNLMDAAALKKLEEGFARIASIATTPDKKSNQLKTLIRNAIAYTGTGAQRFVTPNMSAGDVINQTNNSFALAK